MNLKLLCSICLSFVTNNLMIACGSGSTVLLTSQSEVNSFISNNCSDFEGTIAVLDVNDGSFDITDLSPINSLTSAHALIISGCPLITEINGLNQLLQTSSTIQIYNNSNLSKISGLNTLSSIGGGLYIYNNASLIEISGFTSLVNISLYLLIHNNNLSDGIDGLSSLTTVGTYIDIKDNSQLQNVNGLGGLHTVGGDYIILTNPQLTSIDGSNNLTAVGGMLSIQNNGLLSSLTGFESLNSVGNNLNVRLNSSLSVCCGLFGILYAELQNPSSIGGLVTISGNGAACTQAEILDDGPCALLAFPIINLSTFTGHYNMQDAVDNAHNGDAIKLKQDIVEASLNLNNSVSLNTFPHKLSIAGVFNIPNGKVLTMLNGLIVVYATGSFTNMGTVINDANIECQGTAAFINNGFYKGNGNYYGQFINNGFLSPGF